MIGYIIYGRLKSTRLPKKGLLKIDDKSLINIFIERINTSKNIDKIVFATSELPEDKPLKKLAEKEGLEVYCGQPEDVIMRLYNAAKTFHFDYFLTTMVDGPFQLREVIDESVKKIVNEGYDMVYSYPFQPNGTDCYGLNTKAVQKIIKIKNTTNTEAWGKYFTNTNLFRWCVVNVFENHPDLKDFRLTIDYPEDYIFCQDLYKDLQKKYGLDFTAFNLIELLKTPIYQKRLEEMKQLEKKWNMHFKKSITDVDIDIKRINNFVIKEKEAVL